MTYHSPSPKWESLYRTDVPQQQNNIDCGLYTIATSLQLITGQPLRFSPREASRLRYRLALILAGAKPDKPRYTDDLVDGEGEGKGDQGEGKGYGGGDRERETEEDTAGVGGVNKAVGTGWAKSKVLHTVGEPDHRKRKQRPKAQTTLPNSSAKRLATSPEDLKLRGSQTKTPRNTTAGKRKTTATPRKTRHAHNQEATHRKAKRHCQRQLTLAQFFQKQA